MPTERLHLIRQQFPPPDDYRYTFPEDGWRVTCVSYDGWIAQIKEHAKFNGYILPPDWREIAEDQLCRLLPPGLCAYPNGELPEFYVNARFNVTDVLHGTHVLGAWVAQGMPLVERTAAEARGKTCASCYANVHIPGCAPCVGLANLVAEVAGTTPLSSDPYLEDRACVYCKCSSRANVWVPVEISRHGVTPEMLAAMPAEWCWKRREIEALGS